MSKHLTYLVILTIFTNVIGIEKETTEIANERDDRILLFVTLDGQSVGVERDTGKILWRLRDKPIVQVPLNVSNAIIPIFLPDPRDGSLYLLGDNREPLKKLPFTIPQLVATSPCKSSDGILYTGKKKDSWFKLDPITGNRQQILGWESFDKTQCPILTENSIYIGLTKYKIMMVDSMKPERKWNVTYYDYRSIKMSKDELNSYDLVHLASSSSGRLITMDRRTGKILWDINLSSPIVSVYLIITDGLLVVPLTNLANHTLAHLLTVVEKQDITNPNRWQLYPTLYIGDHKYGLYALPSLVDQNVVTITAWDNGPLLLDGPGSPGPPIPYPEYPFYGNLSLNRLIFIGHYERPNFSEITKFLFLTQPTIHTTTNLITDASSVTNPSKSRMIIKEKFEQFYQQQENKSLKILIIILIISVLVMYYHLQKQIMPSGMDLVHYNEKNMEIIHHHPDGIVKVGKITFNPRHLLGKGCDGTSVYRGTFDGRQVAIKRLLPDSITLIEREVALLRESDKHPNVIRYYCWEKDHLFHYIALELCEATLSDYVTDTVLPTLITPIDILEQTTNGLEHLHQLNIVHRDIKPHNVLITKLDNRGRVKVMLSDFGLCKKLQMDHLTFSRRSGIIGTDGWIAPEMFHKNDNRGMTCAIDLFSLGCLYYYVLSGGSHPFGDTLRRQSNILNGLWRLDGLDVDDRWEAWSWKLLVVALIDSDPNRRPSCSICLNMPIFWNSDKILAFFQDVSDRIEHCTSDDPIMLGLQTDSAPVVRHDWLIHIDDVLAADLRHYRSYRGDSIRDLLRAMRNKRHHWRELSADARLLLGDTPHTFLSYWLKRFPLLFVHVYVMMQLVRNENAFLTYYPINDQIDGQQCHLLTLEPFKDDIDAYYQADVGRLRELSVAFIDGATVTNHDKMKARRRHHSMKSRKKVYGKGGHADEKKKLVWAIRDGV